MEEFTSNGQEYSGKVAAFADNSGSTRKKLALHACCAPCSSYTLEYLSPEYDIELYFYNPNIMPEDEYLKRLSELKRLTGNFENVNLTVGEYDTERFLSLTKGFEDEPEGGARCEICIRHRLEETARFAAKIKASCFSTTLTISPHKNAEFINFTQAELEKTIGVKSLSLNLKKKNGYLRSIELSKKYNLYRQKYCGCLFNK
ncbi:MAG: epoxyqueuosine reductase QueH [Ruminococcus sp.]|jgi:predicted adenine nucleotide alpha hydrolase (AANH) superfamily ATPase|nr:epoxyqueuosine reductase QueH [Ruminococcus sp.]